jgi:precorrin-3B synthase
VREPVAEEAGAAARAAEIAPVIRHACPSVHEPFAQLDGALVRIRVPGGLLTSHQVRRIAEAASDYGTVVEITSRANLQIRGVTTGSHLRLVQDLVAAGVTLADAAADARRNVLASPTAGFDPGEVADTRPLTTALADALVHASGIGLSPKFGVLVDGGGAVHVRGRRQDICLGAVRLVGGSWGYEVRLGQPLPQFEDAEPIVVVSPGDACGLVRSALDLMAEYAEVGGRLSGLIGLLGLNAVLGLLTTRGDLHLFEVTPSERERATTPSLHPVGELPQRGTGHAMVGAMPVLGRLTGQQLAAIANVAEDFCEGDGEAEVRLTPWRSVVIPNVAHQRASLALQELQQLELAVDVTDPALFVVACAGSTGCPSSFTDTQRDATAMVESLRNATNRSGFSVHFSGCSKRCADSTTTFDVTLVGGPNPGTYEVVARRDLYESDALTQGSLAAEGALASVLSAAGSATT